MTVEQLIDLLSAVENNKLEVVINADGESIDITGIDVAEYVWIEN